MKRILITGPGGRIGPQILPLLRPRYKLRLFDLKPVPVERGDQMVVGDIRDFDALREACVGVDALVHLAAISDEDDFHTRLLPYNLEGGYNAFEAARQAGVARVIFASTGQTTVNYPDRQVVTTDMPARPCTVYACTKLFGEALGRYYVDQHGMSVICLRICWFQPYDSPLLRIPGHRIQHQWCSPRDLAQLLTKSLESDLKWGVFFALSNNRSRCWDIDNAREQLGYQPEDDAEELLDF
jgi:uronate dehydrogenase